MNLKEQPNRQRYIEVLRRMTPEQRLQKTLELSGLGKQLLATGLRKRFPGLSEDELRKLLQERLDRCHNRNY